MRVLLKFTIDADADAAWRALHSPRAVAELYGPLVDMQPVSTIPTRWNDGEDATVGLFFGGLLPMGTQLIEVHDRELDDGAGRVRIFRDTGIPLSGPLGSLRVWDHQMAVSADPADASRTLWRERLVFGGPTAPALWPVLWATWQWRAARIRTLAPSWAHDPDGSDEAQAAATPPAAAAPVEPTENR